MMMFGFEFDATRINVSLQQLNLDLMMFSIAFKKWLNPSFYWWEISHHCCSIHAGHKSNENICQWYFAFFFNLIKKFFFNFLNSSWFSCANFHINNISYPPFIIFFYYLLCSICPLVRMLKEREIMICMDDLLWMMLMRLKNINLIPNDKIIAWMNLAGICPLL